MTTATTQPRSRTTQQDPAQAAPKSSPIAPTTMLLFVLGVVLLIGRALAISHLGDWANTHGQILVFVAFFIVMSLAGRWFWGGIDAALTRLRGQ